MWRERLRPLLAQHLTNENRSKVAMLGVGCFYVYFNGCWIYMKMRSAKSPGDYRLDGPFPQMFTSEMISHFSPYILPSYVKGGCMSGILRDISTDSRDFRDRLITYISLYKILQNHTCARSLFRGMNDFGPIMKDIIAPKDLPKSVSGSDPSDVQEPEMLFNVKINCLEHYLNAIPRENRQVDYDDLLLLTKLARLYPSSKAQERVSKILRLFFENEENCVTVARKEFEMFESCQLIHEDGKTPPDMILRFLYATKLSGPWILAMFNEATPTAINNSISIDSINKVVKPLGMVLAPPNASKWQFEEAQTVLSAFEISYVYAFLRNLFSGKLPGVARGHKFRGALVDGLKTTRGVLIYHVIYMLQTKIIHSERYFNNDSFMVPFCAHEFSDLFDILDGAKFSEHHASIFFAPNVVAQALQLVGGGLYDYVD